VVVALAVGWWLDRDRIRTEWLALKAAEKKVADEIAMLQGLRVKQARSRLAVAEAELASIQEITHKNPGALSDAELRRFEAQVELAKVGLAIAEAMESAESIQATAGKLNGP
jgi:hypothetical protein